MKIILDFEFLESFFLREDDSERYFYLTRLLTSASSPSEIVVDFDFEEAYSDPAKRPIFRKIAQKMPLSDLDVLKKAQASEFHETDEANLFFVENKNIDFEQYGCFSMNSDSLEKADNLLEATDVRIDSNHRDWSFLKKYKIPCNSIIVTDNYLFPNDPRLENTFSILKSLMPTRLSIDFHLTIIGFDPKNHFKNINDSYKALVENLSTFPYPVRITIIREDHHPRMIHTNYVRFLTERGFALFSNGKIKRSNETTLSVGSVFSFTNNSSIARNAEIDVCKRINRTDRMPDKLAGSRTNRLLSV